MIDVNNKRCEYPHCMTKPCYGSQNNNNARMCAQHRLSDMINIISKTCEYPNCRIVPIFGMEGESVQFCRQHMR